MKKASFVIMGKTGAGKSTLVNAVLGEEVAEIGTGTAITQENREYAKDIVLERGTAMSISLYDTVGLEVDSTITESTISKIEKHIEQIENNNNKDDVTAVWFCINWKCNRFESYELDLIKRLSVDRCIPFIIVLTQCPDNSVGELEVSIKEMIPEIPVIRILAKDYKSRAGTHKAYGVKKLLDTTINEYPRLKIRIAMNKISNIQEKEEMRIQKLQSDGKGYIGYYSYKAAKAGWIPIFSIPYIHYLRKEMMGDLSKLFGLRIQSEEIDAYIIQVISDILMVVPILSRATSEAYISTIGESYLNALLKLARKHSNYELEKTEYILDELKKNIGK